VRIVHIDPVTGASGHMLLGALIDAGAKAASVMEVLQLLPVSGWEVEIDEVVEGGVGAIRVRVTSDAAGVVRTWSNIRELLTSAPLPEPVRERSIGTFRRLADAEARVHRIDTERVHFHEIDVLDAIVSVVGVCAALHLLDVHRVSCGPVPQGVGMMRSARGHVPLPAPTVLDLLQGAPTYSLGVPTELCTPTGAALLAEWVDTWSEMPPMILGPTGYGVGSAELDRPNLLRVVVGEHVDRAASGTLLLLEAVTEARSDRELPDLLDSLRRAGATEAWARPAVRDAGGQSFELACLVPPDAGEAVRTVLAREAGAQRVIGRSVDTWQDPAQDTGEGAEWRPGEGTPRPPPTA
jgi:pyridinium-3,5-bisthiocarboxylic acid mononucleotide nickel chelatase